MNFVYKKFLSLGNRMQNKIFLPFIAVMVLIGAVIIYAMTDLVSSNVEARVTEKLQNDVRLIQEVFSDMEKTLAFYAQFMADTEKLAGHISEERDSRLVLIYLLEFLKRNQISSNIGGPGDINMSDPGLRRLGTLGVRATGMTLQKEGMEPAISLAAVAPIEGRTGSRSVITVSRQLDRDFLQDLCRKTGAQKIQVFFKNVYVTSDASKDPCDTCMKETLAAKRKSMTVDQVRPYFANCSCLRHSVKIMLAPISVNYKKTGLVAVFESVDDLARAKQNIIIITVVVVGLMLLVIVPIYIRTVSRTVRPIRELSRASRSVAEGNLDQYVPVKSRDEVGELSRSFNKMVSDLKQYREELERWNQRLEDRVAERGRQLAETQAKLVQSTKLAAVGELAAGIAHELNNPLAGIYAFVQVFEETVRSRSLKNLSDEEVRSFKENLSHVEREIQRCKSIIGSLLKFARVSEKHFTIVNINSVIQDILGFIQRNLEKNNIAVEIDFAENLPPVRGDANELQQVFLNLIVNARNAMEKGGRIRIVTAKGMENQRVEVSISDTGEGIREEILDKIFDPFFTTREPGEGTGLGLSISYGIVKDHRGDILVNSTVGEGSTFTVILPVAEQDDRQGAPSSAIGASGERTE